MEYEALEDVLMDYFGDTSRSAGETKRDLLTLAQRCKELAETIDADDE